MPTAMSSLNRREKRRADRLEEMLDAAMGIALTEGLDKLTIAHVARNVDAAVGALYRYFPSKDALVAAMQKRAIELLRGDLQQSFDLAEPTLLRLSNNAAALARSVLIAPAYLSDAVNEPERHRLIDSWVSSPAKLLSDEEATAVNETLAPILMLAINRLEEAVALSALDEGDPVARAHVIWATVHGLDHFRKRDRIQPEHLRVPMLLDEALRTLLVGWGADCDEAAQAVAALRSIAATLVG